MIEVEEIIDNVCRDYQETDHIVITGGEPCLSAGIIPLTRGLQDMGKHVTIETAGTICHPFNDLDPDLYSISPKMKNSLPNPNTRERRLHEKNNIFRCQLLIFDHQIKFVVEGTKDLPEILDFIDNYGIDKSRVFLMPQAVTQQEWQPAARRTAAICLEHGFQMSGRLHIAIWSDERAR